MKKYVSIYLLSFLMIVGLVSSCSKSDMGAMIPKDAVYVLSFNVEKAIDAADASDEDCELLKAQIEQFLGESRYSVDVRDALKQIVDDPSKMGMDLREPLLMFSTPELGGAMVAVGTVLNKGDLENFMKTMHDINSKLSATKEYNGFSYVYMKHSALFAFNDDKFLLYPGHYRDEEDDLLRKAERLFELKEDLSMSGNEAFQKMGGKDGVMKMLFLGESFEKMLLQSGLDADEIRKGLPESVKMSDYAMLSNLQINKGNAELEYEVYPMSAEAETCLDNLPVGEVDNEFGDYLSEKSLFYAVGNVEGSLVWDMMKTNDEFMRNFKRDPKMKAAVETIFKTIDGDFAVALENVDQDVPDLTFLVQTKDAKWLDLLADVNDPQLVKKDDKTYVYTETDYRGNTEGFMKFGDNDGSAYVLTGLNEKNLEKAGEAVSETGKGYNFYGRVNVDRLFEIPSVARKLQRQTMGMGDNIVDLFDYMEFYSEDRCKATVRLVMKDNDKTPVKAIYDELMRMFMRNK